MEVPAEREAEGQASEPLADDVEDGAVVEGDGGDEVVGREVREPSVLDRIQDDLDGVERALQRLDEGSYGTCESCGAAIDDELLAGRPIARFCTEHEVAPAS